MGKLSGKQQQRLYTEFKIASKGNEKLVQGFGELLNVSKGTRKNTFDKGFATKFLGGGGVLAMNLLELRDQLGSLGTMEGKNLAAWEKATNQTGKQLTATFNIARDMEGTWNKLSEMSKNDKLYAEKLPSEIEAMQREQVRSMGSYISENGEIIKARLTENAEGEEKIAEKGQTVIKKGFTEFIMAQANVFGKVTKEEVDRQLKVAEEVAQNTTDMNKILEMGVERMLEKIYNVVAWMRAFFSGVDPKEKKERAKAAGMFLKAEEEARDAQKELRQEISDLGKKLRTPKLDEDKRKELEGEIAGKERALKVARGKEEAMGRMGAKVITQEGAGLMQRLTEKVGLGGDLKEAPEFIAGEMGRLVKSGEAREIAEKIQGKKKYKDIEEKDWFSKNLAHRKKRRYADVYQERVQRYQKGGMSLGESQRKAKGESKEITREALGRVSWKAAGGHAQRASKKAVDEEVLGDLGLKTKTRKVQRRETTKLDQQLDLARSIISDLAPGLAGKGGPTGKKQWVEEKYTESLSEALERAQGEGAEIQKRADDKREAERKQHAEGKGARASGKIIADEMAKRREKDHAKQAAASAGLKGPAFTKAVHAIQSAAKNQKSLPPWLEEKLKGKKTGIAGKMTGESSVKNLLSMGGGEAPEQEFLMRVGGGGKVKSIIPHAEQDVYGIIGAKPGGAVDRSQRKGGGGGGSIVVNNEFHLYGTPQENYKQIKQALATAFGRDYFVGMGT